MLSQVFVTLLFLSPSIAWADDGVVVEKDGTMRVGVPGAVLDLAVKGKCDGVLWITYPTTDASQKANEGNSANQCDFFGRDLQDCTEKSKCSLAKDSDGFLEVVVKELPGGCTVSFPNAFLHRKSDDLTSGVPVAAIVVPVVIGVLLLTAVGIFVGWKCWRRRRSVGNSAPAPVIFPTKPEDPAKEGKAVPPHDGLPEVVVEKPPRPPPTIPAPAKPKAPVPSSGVPPTSTAPTPTPTLTPPPTPTPSAPPVGDTHAQEGTTKGGSARRCSHCARRHCSHKRFQRLRWSKTSKEETRQFRPNGGRTPGTRPCPSNRCHHSHRSNAVGRPPLHRRAHARPRTKDHPAVAEAGGRRGGSGVL